MDEEHYSHRTNCLESQKEQSLTGKVLGYCALQELQGLDVPLSKCVVIVTDNCAVSEKIGTVSEIQG
ncbi:hypothetical protein PR048_003183 [Dryococelus australis]|uniref:Uncharacterized protein n=1 Tax=Dryococelus australis TaxID=614101 RepID=A0ABQ9IM99_9NEOP|nr:hypothetical protein PR048_003183 [Dryococelus australis]